MVWSSNWNHDDWEGPRQYVGVTRAVGVLVDWQHKSGRSFGWIAPIYGMPQGLPQSSSHGGDVYVNHRDIRDPRPGAVVTFVPYVDQQGLGAEGCAPRPVLRCCVPRESNSQLTLPHREEAPSGSYLTSSVFFPELEERGVTLRKYTWDAPLTVFEFWGSPQDVVAAADEIGLLAHPEAELLASRGMVRHESPDDFRVISEQELPFVPPPFRFGFALGPLSAEEGRRKMMSLMGS
mmetsp:Transcript_56819/g.164595  ORF Transcript_56819/g.164595 Transcript_56819/m.164595 type:complete len:235 (+) Transcript_56819:83-787(+)